MNTSPLGFWGSVCILLSTVLCLSDVVATGVAVVSLLVGPSGLGGRGVLGPVGGEGGGGGSSVGFGVGLVVGLEVGLLVVTGGIYGVFGGHLVLPTSGIQLLCLPSPFEMVPFPFGTWIGPEGSIITFGIS